MVMIFTKAGKSLLFLKKKKQKDFFPAARRGQRPTDISFLVLFFKKEHFS
jgi:hypothetical protein